jgi:putative ABC transport system ATP-binding protein
MIKLSGISKLYKKGSVEIKALSEITLEIKEGEFCAIIGASGSGKSTLLNIISCLDRPTKGEYLLDGEDVACKKDEELARIRNKKIGFVFQNFNLLPRFSALRNVELPLFYSGIPQKEGRERAISLLSSLFLSDRLKHLPSELSGGEMQRVAIARALVNNPRVICADEPTGNLDSKTGRQIMEVFKGLNSQGVTIILITHELEFASFSQSRIKIKDGKIVSDETQ